MRCHLTLYLEQDMMAAAAIREPYIQKSTFIDHSADDFPETALYPSLRTCYNQKKIDA